MIVVSNATPLITLAKVGYFDVLQKLFTEITISQEVWNEVVVNGAGRSGSVETARASWIEVVALTNASQLSNWHTRYSLGAGEVSTILLAKELSAGLALIDERKARTLAANQGLMLSGSIAALEQGYRDHHVKNLRQTYLDLLAAKIWVDRKILNQSLARVGLQPL